MKTRNIFAALLVAGAAPVLAADLAIPEIRTLENENVLTFAAAPVPGVTLPTPAGDAHLCNYRYYPAMSQRFHEEGVAQLEFTIKADGGISPPRISQSSGRARLDEAGLACVQKWRYRPALRNGEPVPVRNTVTIAWIMKP